MAPPSLRDLNTRARAVIVFERFLYFAFMLTLWGCLFLMQFDGVPITLAAIQTGLAAFASLLYNRARAHPEGTRQWQTLMAAEEALASTLLFFVGMALAAAVFIPLVKFGYEPSRGLFSLRILWDALLRFSLCFPTMWFCALAFFRLSRAVRFIAGDLFGIAAYGEKL